MSRLHNKAMNKIYFFECYRNKRFVCNRRIFIHFAALWEAFIDASITPHAICRPLRSRLRNKQASASLRPVTTCSGGSHKASRLYMDGRLFQPSINQNWIASGQPRNSSRGLRLQLNIIKIRLIKKFLIINLHRHVKAANWIKHCTRWRRAET